VLYESSVECSRNPWIAMISGRSVATTADKALANTNDSLATSLAVRLDKHQEITFTQRGVELVCGEDGGRASAVGFTSLTVETADTDESVFTRWIMASTCSCNNAGGRSTDSANVGLITTFNVSGVGSDSSVGS
jgi:hypothetical protein